MTKFAKIVPVLAVILALAACSTGAAQSESTTKGDATFSGSMSK